MGSQHWPKGISLSQQLALHAQGTLTLLDIWSVLRRRVRVIAAFCVCVVVLAILYCLISPRYYQAVSQIQVQKESTDALNLDNLTGSSATGSDALESSIDLQTQASILQSETLALRVIQSLDLEHTPDFKMAGIPPKGSGPSLESSPARTAHAVAVFRRMLVVQPVAGTKLISVSYMDRDPVRAAAVVNTLVQDLLAYTFQNRYEATASTSAWLTDQLADLRKQNEQLQSKVVGMQKQTGIFSTGDVDAQGKGQSYSSTLDELQQATAAVSQARANRVLKGAINDVVSHGDPEAVSNLSGTTMANSSPGVANSLSLLQGLRSQESTTEEELGRARSEYGPNYPDLIDLQASLKAIQASIRAETARIAQRAASDYQIANLTAQKTQSNYEAVRRAANTINDRTIDYVTTRQEAEQSRELYEDLLRRLKEAGILEGLHSSNIAVVDKARTPAIPAKPKRTLIVLAAAAASLVLGCILAFVLEGIDDRVQTESDLDHLTDFPLLATLPIWAATAAEPTGTDGGLRGSVEILQRPRAPYAEAIRLLRSALLLAHSGQPPQVIAVASSVSGEGKTMLSLNLAIAFAQQGRRVLLVEADLRRPVHSLLFALDAKTGLSTMLTDQAAPSAIRPFPPMPQLDILPAGPLPPFPADLLESATMQQLLTEWKKTYSIILLDGPPAMPIVDALVLARLADLALFVIRSGVARRSTLRSATQVFADNVHTKLGAVLYGVSGKIDSYYSNEAQG